MAEQVALREHQCQWVYDHGDRRAGRVPVWRCADTSCGLEEEVATPSSLRSPHNLVTPVTHACGHESVRTVTRYNFEIKKQEPVLDTPDLSPETIRRESRRTIRFWSKMKCQACWQAARQSEE